MDIEQEKRFIEALLGFVERASKPDATAAEVEALAAVAKVLNESPRFR